MPEFFSAIDNSTDIGGKVKDFMGDKDEKSEEKKAEKNDNK
jgi:hypothetical protein